MLRIQVFLHTFAKKALIDHRRGARWESGAQIVQSASRCMLVLNCTLHNTVIMSQLALRRHLPLMHINVCQLPSAFITPDPAVNVLFHCSTLVHLEEVGVERP